MQVYCIQYSRIKGLLFFLACLASLGMLWIITYWLPRYKRKFLYKYSIIEICSHFLILNWDDEWTLVRKELVTVQKDESSFIQAFGMTNRFLKYYFDTTSKTMQAVEFPINQKLYQEFHFQKTRKCYIGIESYQSYELAKACYNECNMEIPVPSYFTLVINSLVHPFFLFQLYSIILWIYEEYYYFGTMIVLMSFYSLLSEIYLAKQNWVNLSRMANTNSITQEYATYDPLGPLRQVNTKKIVCGTIIYVNENFRLPCDCILLQGECLIDEASLTGETIPVIKNNIEHTFHEIQLKKKNILYGGTTIVQISKSSHENYSTGLPCLVIATNYSTAKGQLFRSIMFPKPHKFKFFTESIQFLLILGFITIVGFFVILPDMITKVKANTWDIVLTLLDSITITIPPTLPAAMNFGVSFALERLKRNNIFCIQPPKVIVSGRVDTICFDKTGTLTQQGMSIKDIFPNQESIKGDVQEMLLDCMVCCQSLVKVRKELQKKIETKVKTKQIALAEENNYEIKILGDPMECQMFEHAQGDIELVDLEHNIRQKITRNNEELKENKCFYLRRKFDFTSEEQKMSVIVEDETTKQFFLFIKGAPEVLLNQLQQIKKILINLCDDTINQEEQNKTFQKCTQVGLRTIALAYRKINYEQTFLPRYELERNLIFLGFVVFENKLKPESPNVIGQLRKAQIDCKILTGDNLITSFFVADECQFLDKEKKIVTITQEQDQICVQTYKSPEDVKNNIIMKTEYLNKNKEPPSSNESSQIALEDFSDKSSQQLLDQLFDILCPEQLFEKNQQILINGQAFELLSDNIYTDYLLQRRIVTVNKKKLLLFKSLLIGCVVFARMKPSQKTLVVELLQNILRFQKTVGMVGDGSNDCGALKQADSGLDLSETETSISAPFTSKVLNISAVLVLLRNGRAALASNFQCFKFMALYSLIQYVSTIILSFTFSQMSDMQFLYIDLIIICPIFTTMALTEPYDEISIQRPSGSLFSLQCMVSVFGQVILQTTAQVSITLIMIQQDFYPGIDENINYFHENNDFVIQCVDTTTNFVFNNFLYVASIMAFSVSKPFRKPFYSNKYFTLTIIFIWFANILLTFYPWARLPDLEFYEQTPQKWLIFVIVYAHLWSLFFYTWENFVCVNLILRWNLYKKQNSSSISFQELD